MKEEEGEKGEIMKHFTSYVVSGLLITLFTSAIAFGQATAQMSGTVKDQTGAVLPSVEITATQT